MRGTEKEIAKIDDEEKYWLELSMHIPTWRLHGWTFKHYATHFTETGPLRITGQQRDDIIASCADSPSKRRKR